MTLSNWQPELIDSIRGRLEADPHVLVLAVFGSSAEATADQWSDVDLLVVMHPDANELYATSADWLADFGEVFATETSRSTYNRVLRVCFSDFRRVDFVFTTEAELAEIDDWPVVAFWKLGHILFSRSPLTNHVLGQTFTPKPPQVTAAWVEKMVNAFWFRATIAVTKIARGDRLIGLHLALDLVRDCCIVGMILRDRAAQTNHHRTGNEHDAIVADLPTIRSYDPASILDLIDASGQAFDALVAKWDEEYQPRHDTFKTYIELARKQVEHD